MNDPFGFARKWRRLGQERGDIAFGARAVHASQSGKKVGQTDRAHAHAATAQKIATRQGEVLWIRRMVVHAIKASTSVAALEFILAPIDNKFRAAFQADFSAPSLGMLPPVGQLFGW
jgi:hypothetical protein